MTCPTSSVIAVMVTHEGAAHLDAQLRSMAAQTRPIDRLVVLDDDSGDDTLDILHAYRDVLPIEVHSTAVPRVSSESTFARIGRNFRDAIRLAVPGDADVVLFADQDDVWESDRVAHQSERIGSASASAASADCIDVDGRPTGSTLDVFYPRPTNWSSLDSAEQLRAALTLPLATGAAMAVHGAFLRRVPEVPAGWLHDRWYSLCAAVEGGLDIDPRPVIRYRLHAAQTVGASGSGRSAARDRVAAWARRPGAVVRRLEDIRGLGVLAPDAAVRAELRRRALVGTMLRRAFEAAA
ncbi:glycosyltransferase [Curtobacterium flaccumfaciens]|nr:glycosyltransferase [Curtobacterium flaccumfaciens]